MLHPSRARLVLARLDHPAEACTPARLATAIDLVERVRSAGAAWTVAGETVHRFDPGAAVRSPNLVCSCPRAWHCPHVAAVLLEHASHDPDLTELLTQPLWEAVLGPVLGAAQPAPRRATAHLLFRIAASPGPFTVRVAWRRRGVSGGWLAAVPVPRDLATLRTKAVMSDADAHAAELAADLDQVRALARSRSGSHRAGVVATRLARRLVHALAAVDDVRVGDRTVRATRDVVRPTLRATRSGSGLVLAWEPGILRVWDEGVVATTDARLALLDPDVPEAVRARLTTALPAVPADEVQAFADRAVAAGVRVAMPDDLAAAHAPDAREARLVLAEDGATLHVRLVLAYTRGGAVAAVTPGAPGTSVVAAGGGHIARDADWETHERARFEGALGARDGASFAGAAAHAFLVDTLPGLKERWVVYGEDGLVRHRYRGTLTPSVGFVSGEDWFDLDVRFTAGERRAPVAQVLTSWLEGRRAVRLTDGSLAGLPAKWLARHARVVDDLRTVKRAQERLGGWAAWMTTELLAECGATGAHLWHQLAAQVDTRPVPKRAPPGFVGTLRPYQRGGYAWLLHLRDLGLHGVLADDMGLGKTVQALAALVDTHATPGHPSLVVAPTSVLPGWEQAAAQFAPGLRLHLHHGAKRGDLPADADVVLTTWGVLRHDVATLSAREWRWLILDEAQAIKNPGSRVTRATRRLIARHRLAMTGTPVENHLTELWSLFTVLLPGLLGSRRSFHARYAGPAHQDGDAAALADLRRRIRPFVLRRTKDEVAPELPPRTTVTLYCELSPTERELYDRVRATYRHSVAQRRSRSSDGSVRLHVLEALGRLREAACHPALLPFPEARRLRRSAKLALATDLLADLREEGRRALVFSQWPRLLHRLAARLPGEVLLLEGATRDRASLVEQWQAPDGPSAFLISLKAGGTGLNLQAADVVILLDPWWNPAVEAQAIDRVHRIGQDRPVTVYKIVARDTIEERVLRLQEKKQLLFDQVVGPLVDVELGLGVGDSE